jgi:hypothetical protein
LRFLETGRHPAEIVPDLVGKMGAEPVEELLDVLELALPLARPDFQKLLQVALG